MTRKRMGLSARTCVMDHKEHGDWEDSHPNPPTDQTADSTAGLLAKVTPAAGPLRQMNDTTGAHPAIWETEHGDWKGHDANPRRIRNQTRWLVHSYTLRQQ